MVTDLLLEAFSIQSQWSYIIADRPLMAPSFMYILKMYYFKQNKSNQRVFFAINLAFFVRLHLGPLFVDF